MIRLNKWLAQLGLCSRREADDYISKGLVKVNDRIVNELGSKFNPQEDRVVLQPAAQREQARKQTILFNKPLGIVSCQPEAGYQPAISLLEWENEWKWNRLSSSSAAAKTAATHQNNVVLPPSPRQQTKLAVCGRLDVNSSGLLLFTQDGRIAKKVLGNSIEKEYIVRLKQRTTNVPLTQLREGIWDSGDWLSAVSVDILNEDQLRFVLVDGKHHHIRRMCRHIGADVLALKRVRIGNLRLKDLPIGKWRFWQKGDSL